MTCAVVHSKQTLAGLSKLPTGTLPGPHSLGAGCSFGASDSVKTYAWPLRPRSSAAALCSSAAAAVAGNGGVTSKNTCRHGRARRMGAQTNRE